MSEIGWGRSEGKSGAGTQSWVKGMGLGNFCEKVMKGLKILGGG